MSTTQNEVHTQRWREWQLKNEYHERERALRARLVFGALFVALVVWVSFQLA